MSMQYLLVDARLLAIAAILGLWMTLWHVVLTQRSPRIPCWAACALGGGHILLAFTVLYLSRYFPAPVPIHYLQPIVDLYVLSAAAAAGPAASSVWRLWKESADRAQREADAELVTQARASVETHDGR